MSYYSVLSYLKTIYVTAVGRSGSKFSLLQYLLPTKAGFRCDPAMSPSPGLQEVNSFVRKFRNLHAAGWNAELRLGSHGGQLWAALGVQLGEQHSRVVPPPPSKPWPRHVPVSRQTKPPTRRCRKGGQPCREARRARRVLANFLDLPFYCETDETPVHNEAIWGGKWKKVRTSPNLEKSIII